MLRRKLLIATGALALTVPTLAYADTGVDRFDNTADKGRIDSKFVPRYADKDSKVTVMVEMTGDPVAAVQGRTDGELSAARVSQIRAGLKKSQDRVKSEIQDRGGKVLSQMQSAYNGMRVTLPTKQVRAVSQLDGVQAIKAVPRYTLNNTVSVPFLGVPGVWQNSKFRGEGVKVGIIDTGIDYTHADFGGPGTVEAFNAAKASSTFTPTARVKGGWDFVGDDYNADPDSSAYQPVPKPDANPLDCNGHGSHVAGTAAGGGVNEDGSSYTGPYNKSTPSNAFKVGPGVAPKANLYALRVFGCEGSTDVVTEAIDWAVAHKLDVINMSLGSSFGTADDSDSIASQNAQAAGVVVVASAGNAGPNPYIAGSPSNARGVISVAAIDSIGTFTGASLSFNGTTVDAINANGATLLAGPYEIVYVADDPATPHDEALGCVPSDYTAAGINAAADAPLQVAVVQRGSCARVRKPAAGQQAGADAVVMVNDGDGYPPFEGEITSVPADPELVPPLPAEDYHVTIPFLGVLTNDNTALAAADGKALTLAAKDVANPGYKGYASFSSGGPRNGDSGLKPSISAPGVSISSVAVGTGSGSEVLSGTSMAAPHVTGVAALARQAHKKWNSNQIAAALVSTADPANVAGYRLTLGGGLVDAKQVVKTSIYAIGDTYKTAAGKVSEATLSYGFHEFSSSYTGVKKLTLVNKGSKRAIFALSNAKSSQSRPASVRFSRKFLVVPAKSSRSVYVTLKAKASTVGTSLTGPDDQFSFYEVSGNIKIATNGKGTLRVPYLMVPRAKARVAASQSGVFTGAGKPDVKVNGTKPNEGGSPSPSSTMTTTSPSPTPTQTTTSPSPTPTETTTSPSPTPTETTVAPPTPYKADVTLTNPKGALAASADFYTWGLADTRDIDRAEGRGFDLRAAGVQSFDIGGDQLLVFAVNNWTRWSNAAAQEFDVVIDVDRDGAFDFVVFSADSGSDGLTEVFVGNLHTKETVWSGYNAQAPTDSSTILLPVKASQLGIDSDSGAFDYTVASYSLLNSAADEFSGTATYDPFNLAISNGAYETVPVNGSKKVTLSIDPAQVEAQKPLGTMVVVLDNKSGKHEALLLPKP